MAIYEKWVNGVRVSREQPKPDGYDDTRIRLAIMEREQAGGLDGWYRDGEYRPPSQDPYDSWPVDELRTELSMRELPKTGNKAELILRLRANDMETGTVAAPESEE